MTSSIGVLTGIDQAAALLGVAADFITLEYAHLPIEHLTAVRAVLGSVVTTEEVGRDQLVLERSVSEALSAARAHLSEIPSNPRFDVQALMRGGVHPTQLLDRPEASAWVPEVLLELASVTGTQYTAVRALVPLRVVTDPIADQALLQRISATVQRGLDAPERAADLLHGVLGGVLEHSSDPLARRAKAALEAAGDLARARVRLALQDRLSERGLGRINAVSFDDLERLTGDDLADVLDAALAAYERTQAASVAGAVYFIVEKGTERSRFTARFEQLCRSHGWDPALLDLALWCARAAGQRVDGGALARSTMGADAVLLEHIDSFTGHDAVRAIEAYGRACTAAHRFRESRYPFLETVVSDEAPRMGMSTAELLGALEGTARSGGTAALESEEVREAHESLSEAGKELLCLSWYGVEFHRLKQSGRR